MKEVKAYIKPHKLDAVIQALHGIEGLTGGSTVHAHGFGRSKGSSDRHRTDDALAIIAPHVKIEVVCREELVEQVTSAIQAHAHTGLRGDGKIYVSSVEEAIRIATDERGEEAV